MDDVTDVECSTSSLKDRRKTRSRFLYTSMAPDQHQTMKRPLDDTLRVGFQNTTHPHILHSRTLIQISYIRYNFSGLPKSNASTDVYVNSAELSLFAIKNTPPYSKHIVTVSYCKHNSWSETNNATWRTRPCPNTEGTIPLDSIVIGNTSGDIPRYYDWIVTEGVADALTNAQGGPFAEAEDWLLTLFHLKNYTPPPKISLKITGYALNPTQNGSLIFYSENEEKNIPSTPRPQIG